MIETPDSPLLTALQKAAGLLERSEDAGLRQLNSAGQSPTLLVCKTVLERLPSHGSSTAWCLSRTLRMNLVMAMSME